MHQDLHSTGESTTTLALREAAGWRGRWRRFLAVARKELIHILRDPATLFFTLFIPIMEMFMLGYAIDTNVRRIRTVVLDQCRTQESRRLLEQFKNSDIFLIVDEVFTDAALHGAIVAGRARIGLKIPEDYSRKLLAGDTAQVLVLVDGSESSVASTALNVSNALTLRVSLEQLLGSRPLPVESRPQVLFNPDTRSANFFIPGLLVVMCQMMAVTLSAAAIVREKENGTLEQLFMTPVTASELILGKMAPYVFVTMIEFCAIAFLMWLIFRVPIHGAFLTLLGIFLPFLLAMLAIGLWASTRASTRDAAQQIAIGTVIPSIFLSGYVFPLDSMPRLFWWVAQGIPTTWMIDASRGVILRGAGWSELWTHALVLWGMAVFFMMMGAAKFRKQL